ncbi:hypothetical protein ACYOEI_01120 [Singulisphaera rosea]
MTEEEQSIFEAVCDARDCLEEQIAASQQLLEHMKDITAKMGLYLIYRGQDKVPE